MRFCRTRTVPPRRGQPTKQRPIDRIWPALPPENRRKTLQALSRVVAQNLSASPNAPEAPHERS